MPLDSHFLPLCSRLPPCPFAGTIQGKGRQRPAKTNKEFKVTEPEILKVAAGSRTTAVAGAIAGMVREEKQVVLQAVGASAVNQAVKAITIARGYLEQDDIELTFIPSFSEIEIDGQERTALRFHVLPHSPRSELST
ncbi:MAG: stage V sporulation protein S [Anaerolineae bacterium]|nr:stage V sporulation protein S [Anaerolineae bacterium]